MLIQAIHSFYFFSLSLTNDFPKPFLQNFKCLKIKRNSTNKKLQTFGIQKKKLASLISVTQEEEVILSN